MNFKDEWYSIKNGAKYCKLSYAGFYYYLPKLKIMRIGERQVLINIKSLNDLKFSLDFRKGKKGKKL